MVSIRPIEKNTVKLNLLFSHSEQSRMDRLQAMQVFVRVVETGGFTRAADVMSMPKATVTTLVQNLETHLGAKLLNRTTRRVSVTPDGAAYYERCVRILTDIEETEGALSRARSTPRGRLRVDVSGGFGRRFLVPALSEFFERYPEIQLELGCSDRPVDLIEEGVDCVVRGGEQPDSTLIARKLGMIEFVSCATPGYLERHGVPLHPNDLAQHRLINYFSAKTGRMYKREFSRNGERVVLDLRGYVAFNDAEAMFQAGVAGLGIVQASELMACDALRRGAMAQILADWRIDPLPVYLMYPQNRHLSTKVRAFAEWVAEVYERRQRVLAKCDIKETASQI
jgi:LysR family transcriptional regulator, regulator for bpeEF and oprC